MQTFQQVINNRCIVLNMDPNRNQRKNSDSCTDTSQQNLQRSILSDRNLQFTIFAQKIYSHSRILRVNIFK